MADDTLKLIEETEIRLHTELQNIADESHEGFERIRGEVQKLHREIGKVHVDLDSRIAGINNNLKASLDRFEEMLTQTRIDLGRLDERMGNADSAIERLVTVTDRLDTSIDNLNATIGNFQTETAKTFGEVREATGRLDATIAGLDNRIDARMTRATWTVIGGVAAIVGVTATVFALLT